MSWEIDAIHSQVSFAVRHRMVSTVRGRFTILRGRLPIDESQPTLGSKRKVMRPRIDTHHELGDAHLRSGDFFDTDTSPLIPCAKHAGATRWRRSRLG